MAYNYAADGYTDCKEVWSGFWNKKYLSLYIWRKIDPDKNGIWKYALDARDRYNSTISLDTSGLNHLMAEVIYQISSGEVTTEKTEPISIDRFSILLGND